MSELINSYVRASVQALGGLTLLTYGCSQLVLGAKSEKLWKYARAISSFAVVYFISSVIVGYCGSQFSIFPWLQLTINLVTAAVFTALVWASLPTFSNFILTFSFFASATLFLASWILPEYLPGFSGNEIAAVELMLFVPLALTVSLGVDKDTHRKRYLFFSSVVGGMIVADGLTTIIGKANNNVLSIYDLATSSLDGNGLVVWTTITGSIANVLLLFVTWGGLAFVGFLHQLCMRWGFLWYKVQHADHLGNRSGDDSFVYHGCKDPLVEGETRTIRPGDTLHAQMSFLSHRRGRRCPSCGYQNEDDDISYCVECGDRIDIDDEGNEVFANLSTSAVTPPDVSRSAAGVPSRWILEDPVRREAMAKAADPTSMYRVPISKNLTMVAPTNDHADPKSIMLNDPADEVPHYNDFQYSFVGATEITGAEPMTTPNVRKYSIAGTTLFRIMYFLSFLAGLFWLFNLFRFYPQEQPCNDAQPKLSCDLIDQVIVISKNCYPSTKVVDADSNNYVCIRDQPILRWVTYVMFLFSELLNFILALFYYFNMWKPVRRGAKLLDEMAPELPKKDWPTIDVLLCHYQEPVEDTVRTLKAIFSLEYPPELLRVFVLDDGYCKSTWDTHNRFKVVVNQSIISKAGDCRAEVARFIYGKLNPGVGISDDELKEWRKGHTYVRELKNTNGLGVKRRDCGYGSIGDDYDYRHRGFPRLTFVGRMKPEVHHSKAGNINNCLYNEGADGRYILILDNDMKPHPRFLMAVLPFFYSEHVDLSGNIFLSDSITHNSVSFVQTPQYFEDTEQIVVMGDPCGHKNTIFFDAVQCGRDGYDSAAFAGTNALFRRQALDSIGGIQYGTQTEDAWTGNCLHNAGWDSLYFRKDFEGSPAERFRLCVGSVPETVAASMGQRKRWAKGAIQILLMDKHKSEVDPDWRPPKVAVPLPKQELGFPRLLFFLDSTLYPFGSLGAIFYMFIAIYYMCTGYPPIYTEGLWLLYAFLPYITIKWVLNLLANRAVDNNDVWRAQQTWFSYAVPSILAIFEAVMARITGVEKAWANTGAGQKTSIIEVPNVLIFISLAISMVVCMFRFFEYEDATSPWNAAAAAFFGIFIMMQMWPMVRMSIREYAGWDQTTTTFSAAFLGTFLLIATILLVSMWQQTFGPNLAYATSG